MKVTSNLTQNYWVVSTSVVIMRARVPHLRDPLCSPHRNALMVLFQTFLVPGCTKQNKFSPQKERANVCCLSFVYKTTWTFECITVLVLQEIMPFNIDAWKCAVCMCLSSHMCSSQVEPGWGDVWWWWWWRPHLQKLQTFWDLGAPSEVRLRCDHSDPAGQHKRNINGGKF